MALDVRATGNFQAEPLSVGIVPSLIRNFLIKQCRFFFFLILVQRTTMKHVNDLIKHTVSVLSEWNVSFDFEIGF